MLRILLLSLACAVAFVGFAIPFSNPTAGGFVAGAGIVLLGGLLVFLIEIRTRYRLDEESRWNSVMKTEGEELLPREFTRPEED